MRSNLFLYRIHFGNTCTALSHSCTHFIPWYLWKSVVSCILVNFLKGTEFILVFLGLGWPFPSPTSFPDTSEKNLYYAFFLGLPFDILAPTSFCDISGESAVSYLRFLLIPFEEFSVATHVQPFPILYKFSLFFILWCLLKSVVSLIS